MKLFLFLLFPALELYLLVKAGAYVGALNMVFWVFGSALFGFWVMRTRGQNAMEQIRSELAQGKMPQNPFVENLLVFVAGALLILPGLITDALGLLLLLPPVRVWARGAFSRYLAGRQGAGGSRVFFYSSGPGGVHRRGFEETPGFGPNAYSEAEPENPRHARIIESTAIEVESRDAASVPHGEEGEPREGHAPDASGPHRPRDGE